MKDFFSEFESFFDCNSEWLKTHILNLYRLERKQTFPAWQAAAQYTYDLLKQEGFRAERLDFPADGKTVYQDKCMPLGWDVSKMRLQVLSPVKGLENPIIADYEREPLSAVRYSVATPPEGLTTHIVTEAQMKAGENVNGAFVLLNQATRPQGEVVRMLLDLGAVGWISDYLENPHTTPDSVSWIKTGTERNAWHVQAGDRDFISFQVTPRTGLALRAACESGQILVRADSDGHRYETTLPVITALLPGEDSREIWIISHMYAPLIDDNANGVIGSIAILKALRQLQQEGKMQLKYSVRVVFASEIYGFAAYAEYLGGNLSNRVLGAINTAGLTSSYDKSARKAYTVREAPDLPGFAGNILLNAIMAQMLALHPDYRVFPEDHSYGDDCFLSDTTIGCPTVWVKRAHGSGYQRNSWLDADKLDITATVRHLTCNAAWVRAMAAMDAAEVRSLLPETIADAQRFLENAATQTVRQGTDGQARMEFLRNRELCKLQQLSLWGAEADIAAAAAQLAAPESAAAEQRMVQQWYQYADNFVFRRIQRGFPHDLMALPRERRKSMPGNILNDIIANPIARMDGKKTLRQLVQETEWDRGILVNDATVKSWLYLFIQLAEAGYLEMTVRDPLTEEGLLDALRKLGVREGDTLLIHSGLSGLGYFPGGAEAVIRVLRKAVGPAGTFLAPAFTRPYACFVGRINKDYRYRPYDTRPDGSLRDKFIITGTLPNAMLRQPDVCRSGHATHEWVAIGGEAAACVSGHGFLDPPTGLTSPLPKVLARNGSAVFLGCEIENNTFLHYLETEANAPYLQNVVINWLDKNGTLQADMIRQHLPGHRNFYGSGQEFYEKATQMGLHIHSQPFGMATLYRMELPQLARIGRQMFSEDPCALLCSNPNCVFCRSFRKK